MTEEDARAGVVRRPPRKLVLFADGTGNAFGTQESNVWRLYQALDKRQHRDRPEQLARYIPGVGTSSNAVLRLIDKATGVGVPSNVRKLYRFLCWNWRPDDEIYLFGFSRGAFTVRTLAALVAMQGLMPREIDGRPVTSAEMARNAMGAWLAYRTETAPLVRKGTSVWNPLNWQMSPHIAGIRRLREAITWAKRRLLGQLLHREVLTAQLEAWRREAVPIRFMGLFDTVEAYGMPVEEARAVWNRLVWPIQFRNRRASWVVGKVRHALSLDDERLSFHPIRFDISPRPDGRPVPETQEVWFAGVHSDVGGGYPDDATAYEPLLWIAEEAGRQELNFDDEALRHYRARLYPQALIHDSRAGLGTIYRYAPRRIGNAPEEGGTPVLHHSVVAKIVSGTDGYAPLALPQSVRVYPDDGTGWAGLKEIGDCQDPAARAEVQRLVRQRRGTNRTMILGLGVLIALPFVTEAPPVTPWLRSLGNLIGGLVPDWALTWVDALLANWRISGPVVALLLAVHLYSGTLAHSLRDAGRRLWRRLE